MANAVYEKIFAYCERGQDPSFWGEPLNAVSNIGFVLLGLAALWSIGQLRPQDRSLYAWTLALMAILIGIGSFLFHTFAERWAGAMDVIPIQMFMLIAVYTLGRRLFGWPIWAAWAGIFGFIGFGVLLTLAPCPFGVFCASRGYLAAFFTLVIAGAVLARSERSDLAQAGRLLMLAGAVFAVSLTFRSLDRPICDWTIIAGYRAGLHYWWHLLNATVLYLVIRAFWLQEATMQDARAEARAVPA